MGRGIGSGKRRGRGEGMGAGDEDAGEGRVSVHAVNRGGVAQGAASRDGRGGRAATFVVLPLWGWVIEGAGLILFRQSLEGSVLKVEMVTFTPPVQRHSD